MNVDKKDRLTNTIVDDDDDDGDSVIIHIGDHCITKETESDLSKIDKFIKQTHSDYVTECVVPDLDLIREENELVQNIVSSKNINNHPVIAIRGFSGCVIVLYLSNHVQNCRLDLRLCTASN
ncbi:unnamed protein product [Macrosiphum euphorbiae]|uniref:Uncharacterized protein n=1 Tax=Macrosiphum euphorbiae TaxID=13131 RepID=A0AAV0XZ01_9HEMI|nr:unnamed protein product [Macrosiphum euphorbiae]